MKTSSAVLPALLLVACSSDYSAIPIEPDSSTRARGRRRPPGAVLFATRGPSSTESRANLIWHDAVTVGNVSLPAGIRGDERDKFGNPAGSPSNEYQSGHCGVAAIIWNGKNDSGDLKFDPDAGYVSGMAPSCGLSRSLVFLPNGPEAAAVTAGSVMFVPAVWQLSPGESQIQPQTFWVDWVGCPQLVFDGAYPPASAVSVTRLLDAGTARRWLVTSQGSHQAVCVRIDKRGRTIPTGVSYFLPFSFIVTEVPAPWPTYP